MLNAKHWPNRAYLNFFMNFSHCRPLPLPTLQLSYNCVLHFQDWRLCLCRVLVCTQRFHFSMIPLQFVHSRAALLHSIAGLRCCVASWGWDVVLLPGAEELCCFPELGFWDRVTFAGSGSGVSCCGPLLKLGFCGRSWDCAVCKKYFLTLGILVTFSSQRPWSMVLEWLECNKVINVGWVAWVQRKGPSAAIIRRYHVVLFTSDMQLKRCWISASAPPLSCHLLLPGFSSHSNSLLQLGHHIQGHGQHNCSRYTALAISINFFIHLFVM
jgi:hypothetical protein